MRVVWVVVVFLLAGCSQQQPLSASPTAEPAADRIPGWSVDGHSFPNATLAATDHGTVAVLGDRFWLWDVAADNVAAYDMTDDIPVASVRWNGSAWTLVRVQEDYEMYACGPACDAVRIHSHFVVDALVAGQWQRTVDRRSEGNDPEGQTASQSTVTVAGTPVTVDPRYGQFPAGVRAPFMCDGAANAVASDGTWAYASATTGAGSCPEASWHAWRYDPKSDVWQVSAARAPVEVGERPLAWVSGRLLFLGAPTVAYSPGLWWDANARALAPTHSIVANDGTARKVAFSIDPIVVPWANLTADWVYGGYHAAGWNVTFPHAGPGALMRLEVMEQPATFGLHLRFETEIR